MSHRSTLEKGFYRPDIDGLRGIAVLLVVLCHAGFTQFKGGFIGVDIFFVISGFIVSTTIIPNIEQNKLSLVDFYAKRAKRLLPSLYLVCITTFLFSSLFLLPQNLIEVAKNIGYISIFSSNIYLSHQTGYFAPQATDLPLLHTWSLSVEEQFYLILPAALIALLPRGRRFTIVAFGILSLASLYVSETNTSHGNEAAYYLFQNRAFEFLLGVILALCLGQAKAARKWPFDILLLVGLIALGTITYTYSEKTPFPGWHALIPCGAALILIFAGNRTAFFRIFLDNKPLVYAGKISYCLYLWHWPVIFAFNRFGYDSIYGHSVAILISTGLAILTHHLIEKPFRYSATPNKKALLRLMLSPILLSGALIIIGKNTDRFLFLYPEKVVSYYKDAGDLWEAPREKYCWQKIGISNSQQCRLGHEDATPNSVLWGDSHAYHFVNFIDNIGKEKQLTIHDIAYSECPPIANMSATSNDSHYKDNNSRCKIHDKNAMEYILKEPAIRYVFMSAVWHSYQNSGTDQNATYGIGFHPGEFEKELQTTIQQLESAGKQVVILDDIPTIPKSMVNCQAYNELFLPVKQQNCSYPEKLADGNYLSVQDMFGRIKKTNPKVSIINTFNVLCSNGICRTSFGQVPAYRYDDIGHLGVSASKIFFDEYMRRNPGELDKLFPARHNEHIGQKL
ncbi:acyltransferase family protein [Crenobacter sp. SG2303]|uniref:Acyltransferase family protein n=1 Tax=Crenobacter oryzisoli TaxID=3056844 RepID=A0ABT7XUQ4_9NEIS|nr:acyltransferase family protein [Crenobacter sp. SG2303]MDN0077468.1 acyltransferase family protein [Crenobacter sp. SG2303]